MSDRCIIIPSVKVHGEEVESLLFKQIEGYSGSRERAIELWSLSQIPEFMQTLKGIQYDENGEPTFDSYKRAIDMDTYLKGDLGMVGLMKQAGAVDNQGNLIVYKTSREAYQKIIKFNNKYKKAVASVVLTTNGFIINVEKLNLDNLDTKKQVVFLSSLNNRLLGILRSLGFDVSILDNPKFDGIFNPLNAETNALNLKTIIQIAKGKKGEEAFPEEFSHVIIAGLRNHPLVQRLLNNLNEDNIQSILGKDFETYQRLYKGDINRLKEEVAGKLLYQSIVKQETLANRNLLLRLWDFVKSLFLKTQESSIDEALTIAYKEADDLASMVMDNSIIPFIDTSTILDTKPLYRISQEVDTFQALTEQALELMSKRLKVKSLSLKQKEYNESEVKAIYELQDHIEKKLYTKGVTLFLNSSLEEIRSLYDRISNLRLTAGMDKTLLGVRRNAQILRDIKNFAIAYADIIKKLKAAPLLMRSGEMNVTEEDAEKIAGLAGLIDTILGLIDENYQKMRFDLVKNFLSIFWGKDKLVNVGKNKGDLLTLDLIMGNAKKDINGIDRWISSLSDASDPLLSLIDRIVSLRQAKRDNLIQDMVSKITAIHKEFIKNGKDTEFMFEKNSEGKLTGRLISNIDFDRFYKEKKAYRDSLKELGLSQAKIRSKMEVWELKHMKEVDVPYSLEERTHKIPDPDMYYIDRLSKLSKEERNYYDNMMRMKAILEDYIPERSAKLYNAVYIRNDLTEAIFNNISDPKKAAKLALGNLRDKFVRRVDDTEYGDILEGLSEKEKEIMLDFEGRPIESLPVYYTHRLEDMQRLSTDFTGSLIAYAGMAINYKEMSSIVDALELTRDFVRDRDVEQISGDRKLVESFKVLGKEFKKTYVEKGFASSIGKRLDDYYANVLYGKTKKDEGTIEIFEKQIDIAKILDSIKSYSGAVGLGINLFSGLSNVLVGKMQIFIESMGGEYFGYKNSLIGKKNYYKDLPAYMAELGAVQKTSKLGLLIDKFDALEEFHSSLRERGLYKGPLARIIGKTNIYILNNLGEHYLHSRTMLAILDAYRVKDSTGKEISLYDALEVKENEGAYTLELKEGVTKLDGEKITEEDFEELRLKIGKVNQALNGAFNDKDKGAIHKYALGRLAMLFRQWMPAHYLRRFAGRYYDAALEQYREGYYRTLWRFNLNLMKDLCRAKFLMMTLWNNLSNHEKANLKRALTEIGLFIILSFGLSMLGPVKDHKGNWVKRVFLYSLYRLKLEVGASAPITPDFFKNIMTIIRSPAAAANTVDNFLDLLECLNMFHEIQSGRYKGWSEYERDLVLAVPFVGQIRKVFDITDEDYMFAIFGKQYK